MLNPNYNYCFLDFETTGLSHEKDDIIQVGLIIMNSQLGILNSYSSYINPGYEIDKLKTIVSYTTGITPEQILGGISLDEFREKMKELIPKDVVFVGQNIQFDLKFLKKYCGSESWIASSPTNLIPSSSQRRQSIDTLDWAKALIHYLPSYSLDVIYPKIREQLGSDYFQSIAHQVGLQDIQNHDALSDCLICIGLLHFCMLKVQSIVSSFPIAKKIIQKSDMRFWDHEVIDQLPNQALSDKVPLLDFPAKPQSSLIVDDELQRDSFENGSKLYYGNLKIEQLVRKASSLEKYILCTNSKSKLSIIKSKCKSMGLHNISFIKEQQQVDRDKLNKVYAKDKLEIREGRFFLKYCSHKLQGYGLLDLNSAGDYKVYNYIRNEEGEIRNEKGNIVLATHAALFSLIEAEEYKDYTILFLDYERWYNSYLKYKSTPRDPINFARILENFAYQFTNDKAQGQLELVQHLMNMVDMFCGLLFMETSKLTVGKKSDSQGRYELGVISGNISYPKTNDIYKTICNQFVTNNENLESLLDHEDLVTIQKQFDKLHNYMESIVIATPLISDYTQYTFTLGNPFVEYNEFIFLFKNYHHYFLSNSNNTRESINKQPNSVIARNLGISINGDEANQARIEVDTKTFEYVKNKFTEINIIEEIEKIKPQDTIFVLNNNPTKAKKIFEYLQTTHRGQEYKILVENVTGGRGKNIAMTKTSKKRILVGGYEMLLQCIQEKITPNEVIVYEQLGLLHSQIIEDLKYWMG